METVRGARPITSPSQSTIIITAIAMSNQDWISIILAHPVIPRLRSLFASASLGRNGAMPPAYGLCCEADGKGPWLGKVDAITAKLDSGEIGVVQAEGEIDMVLQDSRLLVKQFLNCQSIGKDPANRDIVEEEVAALPSDIAGVGFHAKHAEHAICAEDLPGQWAVEKHNEEMVKGSKVLAPVEKNTIKYGSLACSHNNQSMRSIVAGMPCADEKLSVDGVYSLERMKVTCPAHHEAIVKGMLWRVLKWPIRKHRPNLFAIYVEANNIAGHMQRAVSSVEVIFSFYERAAAAQAKNTEPQWATIKAAVLRSKPPCANMVDDLVYFALKRSGGADGAGIRDLKAFFRLFVQTHKREVPGDVWSACADMTRAWAASSIVKALVTCPAEHVKNRMCEWFSASAVKTLKAERVELVDEALRSARSLLPSLGFTGGKPWNDNILTKVLGRLDVTAGRYLMDKVKDCKDDKDYFTREVLLPFVRQFEEEYADKAPATAFRQHWNITAAHETKEKNKVSHTAPKLVEYNTDGELDDAHAELQAIGFETGATCGPRDEVNSFYKIVDAQKIREVSIVICENLFPDPAPASAPSQDTGTNTAEDHADSNQTAANSPALVKLTRQVSMEHFKSEWVLKDTKKRVSKHPHWPNFCSASTVVNTEDTLLGGVKLVLGVFSHGIAEFCDPKTSVVVMQKGVDDKGGGGTSYVTAAKDFDTRTLVLSPDTTSVRYHDKTPRLTETSSDGFLIDPIMKSHERLPGQWLLSSSVSKEYLAPFWIVKRETTDERKANMTVVWTAAACTGHIDKWGDPKPLLIPSQKRMNEKTHQAHPESPAIPNPESLQVEVSLPTMMNLRPLKAGEELCIYKPRDAPPVHRAKPIDLKKNCRITSTMWKKEAENRSELGRNDAPPGQWMKARARV